MNLIILLLPAAVFVCFMILINRRRAAQPSPRAQRHDNRRVTLRFSLPIMAAVWGWWLWHDPSSPSTIFFGLFVLSLGWQLLQSGPEKFSTDEALANYRADPRHCGQCEYDLTGNESGVCPECGWRIPQEMSGEYIPWAHWWKRWRIEQLDDWRRTLRVTAAFAVLFAGTAIYLDLAGSSIGAVVMGVTSLAFLINAGRVIAYARRQNRRAT